MGIVYDEDDVLIPPGVRALHRSTPGTLQPAPSATQPTAAAGPSVATPSGDADVVLVSPTFPTAPHVKPGETPQPAPPAAPSPAPQLPPNAQPPPSGGPGLGSPPNRGGATKHPTQPTPANGGGDKTGRVIARVDPPFGARPPISSSVARERYAFDYLRDELGLTSVQAAALVGNLSYESTAFLRAGRRGLFRRSEKSAEPESVLLSGLIRRESRPCSPSRKRRVSPGRTFSCSLTTSSRRCERPTRTP